MAANLNLYNWNLITEDFKKACDGLEIGELIKEPKYDFGFLVH